MPVSGLRMILFQVTLWFGHISREAQAGTLHWQVLAQSLTPNLRNSTDILYYYYEYVFIESRGLIDTVDLISRKYCSLNSYGFIYLTSAFAEVPRHKKKIPRCGYRYVCVANLQYNGRCKVIGKPSVPSQILTEISYRVWFAYNYFNSSGLTTAAKEIELLTKAI